MPRHAPEADMPKGSVQRPGSRAAWVIRVASNACKNLLRSRSAHPEVELASAGEPEAAPEPDEDALRLQDERVLNAVMALPVPQREAVYLWTVRSSAGCAVRTFPSMR